MTHPIPVGTLVYVKPGRSSVDFPMRVGRVVESGPRGAQVMPLWPASQRHPFGWGVTELDVLRFWTFGWIWLWLTTTLWRRLWRQGGRA